MIDSELEGEHSAASSVSALPFVLPLVLYLAIGMLEPRFDQGHSPGLASTSSTDTAQTIDSPTATSSVQSQRYVALSLFKFFVVGACLIYFFPSYRRCFPVAINGWGWGAGVLGVVVWVGICSLAWEPKIFAAIGIDLGGTGNRSQFNPFEKIDSSPAQVAFLLARFGLLVLVVPLAEEIFLRGFLMRIIQSGNWTQVSLRDLGWPALLSGSVYGLLTHPNEALAAVAWFSLVSWLMVRTNKFWNCVLAHAVTNGSLGLYVISFRQWQLW